MVRQNTLLNKGFFAIAAVAVAGIIGGVNLVSAQSAKHLSKPSKEECAAAGFANYGSCVSEWAHDNAGYANDV